MSSIWVIVEPAAILVLAVVVAVLGLMVVRRAPIFEQHFTENEVAGLLFSAMGVVYGALLAFVVFAVWQSYSDAQQAVTQEAAAAIAAYRDTQEFPQPQRAQAQADLRAYVDEVVANEWLTMPGMADMSSPPAATQATASPSMPMATDSAGSSIGVATASPSMPMATPSPSAAMPSDSAMSSMGLATGSPSMPMAPAPSKAMATESAKSSMTVATASPSMAMATPAASMAMGPTPSPAMSAAAASSSPSMAIATPTPTPATAAGGSSPSPSMAMVSASPSGIVVTPTPGMAMGTAPDPLDQLWAVYRSVSVAGPAQDASLAALRLNSAFERLHALELDRHLRHLAGETTLPWIFWPILLLGGAITVAFTYFFHQDSHVSQALMTGVITALLTGVLLLIFALNQPFTGPVPVSKLPFEHSLAEFQLIDLGS